MVTRSNLMVHLSMRAPRIASAALLLSTALSVLGMAAPGPLAPRAALAQARPPADREMFGMVMRDPFYEFNTDPVNFPNASNRAALEVQAAELEAAGVKWVRMEFFADYDGSVAAGGINWAKYDPFIREIAPKHGLKVLALLNVGMVAIDGQTLRTLAVNDPPDRAGNDPEDGSNHFIRVFTSRAQAIAARYGSAISAYEIINEPNISYDLWNDSHLSSAEISPERYAALLANAYRAIKSVQPDVQVTTGGMLIGSPPEGQDHDQFDYLYQMYVSPWVDRYRNSGQASRPGWNSVPWDAVAVHPYYLETGKLFPLLKDFARKVRDRGDAKSKLWITEIGMEARPPTNPAAPPNQAEIEQSNYLRAVYTGIFDDPELRSSIAHTFWFKYEDFVPGNYTHNYGLVRLAENATGDKYAASGKVLVHKLAYSTYQQIALGYTPTEPLDRDEISPDSTTYFPETGLSIAPEFASYWKEHGGIGLFGYPISRPVRARGYLSQFFERAVFEYHPEYAGTPYAVLLRLVGNEFTNGRQFDKADQSTMAPERVYFPQTEHTLGGAFLNYWKASGGLAIYGYPISEEISEVSPTNGETYLVQYFERNRFELHPEAAGTPYEVQLGLLGANILKQNMWWR